MNEIKKIGIIGSGKMGTDIFYYLNDFNYNLIWICQYAEMIPDLKKKFEKRISRMLKSEIIDNNLFNNKLNNTIITNDLNELAESDLIIEAIFEELNEKIKLFTDIDGIVKEDCIFATNSSSFIPSKIFKEVSQKRKKRAIGLHFFYPVKLKNVTEVFVTDLNESDIIRIIDNFLEAIKKFHLIINENSRFNLNKLFLIFQNEAFITAKEFGLSYREIDNIIKQNIFPMGVFELFDNVGIDVIYPSVKEFVSGMVDNYYFNDLLTTLKKMIDENKLGIKTNIGFYDYNEKKIYKSEENINSDEIIERLLYIYINSVYIFLEMLPNCKNEIEYAIMEYMDLEQSPFKLSNEIGKENILKKLEKFYKKYNICYYKPSVLLKN